MLVAWTLFMTADLLMPVMISYGRKPLLLLAWKAAFVGFLLIGQSLLLRLVWRSIPRWWARPLLMLAFVCCFFSLAEIPLFQDANLALQAKASAVGQQMLVAGLVLWIVGTFIWALGAMLDDWDTSP
jgi:hypothetical protein